MIEVPWPPAANRLPPGGAFRPPSAAPAHTATPVATPQPRLLDQMREALRSRHYSRRTEQSYCHWVKRFALFHGVRHPSGLAEPEINAFLTHLPVKERVSASTQGQALSARLFLYRHVIGREVGDLGELIRARRPLRVPVVMTRDEVKPVLAQLTGDRWLMASLMYGAGLRLTECLSLRVQDIGFGRNEITVRAGKGDKDRRTMLPESLKRPLEQHLHAAQPRPGGRSQPGGWPMSEDAMPIRIRRRGERTELALGAAQHGPGTYHLDCARRVMRPEPAFGKLRGSIHSVLGG
jgi:integrase